MAINTANIRVGANGTVRVAPTGTAVPADFSASFAAGWVDLGLIDENGVTFEDGKTITDILAWQLLYPARKIVADRTFKVTLVLREWTKASVALAFGGGTFTTTGTGATLVNKYTPPDPHTIDTRQMAVDWVDNAVTYRLVLPQGLVSGNVQTKVFRTGAADLAIEFDVIGVDASAPWLMSNNDALFS